MVGASPAHDLVPPTVPIPGGRFLMGSAAGRPDEAPVHDVEVAPFRIGRTPVTRAQYAVAVSAGVVSAPPWWQDPAFGADDQPVVGVSWFDAVAYCAWLSQRPRSVRHRLPTEAEWECAVRAGLPAMPTAWGLVLPQGEVPTGPLDGPWPVGRGQANPWGVMDPGTSVHEWCLDWYDKNFYRVSPVHDPSGPQEGIRRASRGGSWRHRVRWSPPSARSSLPPESRYADYGFRVVQEAPG